MLFVDSNILIYSELEDYAEHKIAREKLKLTLKTSKLVLNSVIIAEIFHKLYVHLGYDEAELRTRRILDSPNFIFLPIEKQTINRALLIPAKFSIRINDAIIAQHALDIKSDGILTNNVKDFKRVPGLKVISLR